MNYDSDSNFSEGKEDYRAAKCICTSSCAPWHISNEPEVSNSPYSSPNSQQRFEYICDEEDEVLEMFSCSKSGGSAIFPSDESSSSDEETTPNFKDRSHSNKVMSSI